MSAQRHSRRGANPVIATWSAPTIAPKPLTIRLRQERTLRLVTFNYNDLLGPFLERYGVRVRSITACNFLYEPTDVTVMHPQGLVPLNSARPRWGTVVLNSKDMLADQTTWVGQLWDEAILEVLRRHVVIFLGVLRADERLMKLVGIAWEHHSMNSLNIPYFGMRLDAGSDAQFNKWNERGVHVRTATAGSTSVWSSLLCIGVGRLD